MNVQEAVKQTLDIYKSEDEYQSIDNAMDYLLQLLKVDDEARIKKAVYDGVTNPQRETRDPYASGYRAGWNDALREIGMVAGSQIVAAMVNTANAMVKK